MISFQSEKARDLQDNEMTACSLNLTQTCFKSPRILRHSSGPVLPQMFRGMLSKSMFSMDCKTRPIA